MLDGKRYYAVFPDEDPANRNSYSPSLIATWRALEKELGRLFRRERRLKISAGAVWPYSYSKLPIPRVS